MERKRHYYRITMIDGNGKPNYDSLYDMDLYDLVYEGRWLTIHLTTASISKEGLKTVMDEHKATFVRSIPMNRVVDILKVEMDETEAMRRCK